MKFAPNVVAVIAFSRKDFYLCRTNMANVEEMPIFGDGGVDKFCYWVMTHVKYPKRALERGVSLPHEKTIRCFESGSYN